jgi:predicted SprT family Zn-dependent metalloprotease
MDKDSSTRKAGRMQPFVDDEGGDGCSKSISVGWTARTSNFPTQKPYPSEREMSQHDSEGTGSDSDSAKSSVMRFDISHVLDTSPTMDQASQRLLMEPILPQVRTGEGKEDLSAHCSVSSSCEQINPNRKKSDNDDCISSDRQDEDSIYSANNTHKSYAHRAGVVIDLLDTDDEMLPVTSPRHGRKGKGRDLEKSDNSEPFEKLKLSTRSIVIDVDENDGKRFRVASSRPSQEQSEVAFRRLDTSVNAEQLFRMHPGCGKGMSFKKNKSELSARYFQEFNAIAFEGKLTCVNVEWSNKLSTTAGLTRLRRRQQDFIPGLAPSRVATIELSSKVIDDIERLRSTLLHEMVHAAAWVIDGVSKPAHGPCFRKWAAVATSRVPSIEVTTTHDYQIQYKYAWACTSSGCGFLVQRHSRSVDIERHCCGRCRGRLVEVEVPDRSFLLPKGSMDLYKTTKKRDTRAASDYNLFVKEQSKRVRDRLAKQGRFDVSQAEVMKECARLWQIKKNHDRGNV